MKFDVLNGSLSFKVCFCGCNAALHLKLFQSICTIFEYLMGISYILMEFRGAILKFLKRGEVGIVMIYGPAEGVNI